MNDALDGKDLSPLTKEMLDRLLLLLDSDREVAGEKYEILRKKLIQIFAWRVCLCPEELADITIDRAIRKIRSGEIVRDPNKFVQAIAQFVFMEYQRAQKKVMVSSDKVALSQDLSADSTEIEKHELEQRHICLEECLQTLPTDEQDIIKIYYVGEKRERTENRNKIAERFGIPINALYLKVLRIKGKLRECVENCLKRTLEN